MPQMLGVLTQNHVNVMKYLNSLGNGFRLAGYPVIQQYILIVTSCVASIAPPSHDMSHHVAALAKAAASGILLTALSAAGLEVSNCAAECTNVDRDAMSKCREECEIQNFQSQDPAVATCIQFFYFAVIPSCQLIAVVLTYIFPIHSHRLELIYKNQEEIYKPMTGMSDTPKATKATHEVSTVETAPPAPAPVETAPEAVPQAPQAPQATSKTTL